MTSSSTTKTPNKTPNKKPTGTERRHAAHRRRRRTAPGSLFPATTVPTPPSASAAGEQHRLQVAHDIGHACGTVLMLAAALENTPGMTPESRAFAHQLATETRRMNELVAALLRNPGHPQGAASGLATPVRLDAVIRSIVDPIRMTSDVEFDVRVSPVMVEQAPLELWRVLRNLVCNAVAAIESCGRIQIGLVADDGFAVVDIDDDGPGVPPAVPRDAGIGLDIVEDLASGWGGSFEIGKGPLGGCRARLMVPLPDATSCGNEAKGADRHL